MTVRNDLSLIFGILTLTATAQSPRPASAVLKARLLRYCSGSLVERVMHVKGSVRDGCPFEDFFAIRDDIMTLTNLDIYQDSIIGIESTFGMVVNLDRSAVRFNRLFYNVAHTALVRDTASAFCLDTARVEGFKTAMLNQGGLDWRSYFKLRLPERIALFREFHQNLSITDLRFVQTDIDALLGMHTTALSDPYTVDDIISVSGAWQSRCSGSR